MPTGIHVELFISRDNGSDMTQILMEKILRKFLALIGRLGCTGHGTWRIGNPPEIEDQLG